MSDTKEQLQHARRQFPPPPDLMESLRRRRDRKRRNQRITAGVVGIVVFVAAIWVVTTGLPFDHSSMEVVPGGEGTGPADSGPTETGPTENTEAVSQPYEFLHGQVSFSAARAWDYSVAGWEVIPKMITLNHHRDYEERLVLVADPLPVETGCEDGPASADAEALARSIRSDPDLEATEPEVVSVGGIDALRMDVVAATGASLCRVYPAAQVVAPPPSLGPNGDLGFSGVDLAQGQRMRLYLLDLDLPEGPTRMLAIAIIAPDARFEHLVEAAAPIMASFEFRTR